MTERHERVGDNARVLAWKGASVGMSVVRDDADAAFAEVLTDLETSAADVIAGRARDRERGYLDVPFALFGHSMGALLAFEFARRLRRAGGPQPRCLLASGHRALQLPRLNKRASRWNSSARSTTIRSSELHLPSLNHGPSDYPSHFFRR